jgi:superfamily I DNA/RNA helicase
MARTWSAQQEAIFDWFQNGQGNLTVEALAGTGKTTTIIEGINRAPEQSILLAAFNKRIAEELKTKLANPNAEALTLHAIGFRAVRRYWEKIGVDNRGARAERLAEDVCGQQAPDALKKLVGKLGTKAREMAPFATKPEDLFEIALTFDCAPDEGWQADGFDLTWVCDKAVKTLALAASSKPIATGIDFADMLFLPIINKWLRPSYDLVVVDEAQDMTLVQLLLAQGVCKGRFAVVGDSHQAIYAFRGADSDALGRLTRELNSAKLALTTTYRCGQAIVREAQRLVPSYEAAPTNGEGLISTTSLDRIFETVGPGDFVLSRTNAPLVSIALGLVRRGVRAKIEGRDIGAGLKSITNKLAKGPAKNSIPKWLEKLATWRDREVERAEKAGIESKVNTVLDQFETLTALADGVSGIPELLTRIESLFEDNAVGVPSQVVCSSVHRAKGLESKRVFVLRATLNPPVACEKCHKRPRGCKCPDGYVPDPVSQREEQNIEYVAITRAIDELVWVEGDTRRLAR